MVCVRKNVINVRVRSIAKYAQTPGRVLNSFILSRRRIVRPSVVRTICTQCARQRRRGPGRFISGMSHDVAVALSVRVGVRPAPDPAQMLGCSVDRLPRACCYSLRYRTATAASARAATVVVQTSFVHVTLL